MESDGIRPAPPPADDSSGATPREPRDIVAISGLGVLGEFDYRISFGTSNAAERMQVIYAPNGRGKTNFLRGVSLLLTPSIDALQALIDVPVRGLKIEFGSGATVSLSRESAFAGGFDVVATRPEIDDPILISIDPADFAGRIYRRVWAERADFMAYVDLVSGLTRGAVLIGDDRLSTVVSESRDTARQDEVYAASRRRNADVVTRLLERVERMLTQTAFASISRESSLTGVYADITKTTLAGTQNVTTAQARSRLELQIKKLLAAGAGHETYELMSLRQVRDIRSQLVQARANNRRLPALYTILKPYLDSLEDQVISLTPAQQLIDTFVTGVNRFLDRKQLQFSASAGITLQSHKGQRLLPESLSSGERHLLYLLANSVLATAERPLVIIDEPEISLGLEWQRGLLDELLRCTSAAGVQFLVASHSVQVMADVERIVRPTEA